MQLFRARLGDLHGLHKLIFVHTLPREGLMVRVVACVGRRSGESYERAFRDLDEVLTAYAHYRLPNGQAVNRQNVGAWIATTGATHGDDD